MMARLFALTVFLYPLALALLCTGAGLLIDRGSGGFLPAALLPSVGAAGLIALSQLSTYVSGLAPATPYLIAVAALSGFALAHRRARLLIAGLRGRWWLALVPLLAYLLGIAPVLLAGRASFSSFMALSDSAVHMIGADYLIHHGQDYAHLDLHNSYGQFIDNYYGTSYPSGADTLFGGSALLLHLPLIWSFQPFNALMLAIGAGPAWLLARSIGLRGTWAALAALSATVPALVYGYELIGSIKELTALAMILTLGALVVLHRRWLLRAPIRAAPFALVVAAGVSAIGVGFGAWALAAAAVLLAVVIGEQSQTGSRRGRPPAPAAPGRPPARSALGTAALGTVVLLVAAWPTWVHLSGSLHVAQSVASSGNAGNLPTPLKWTQVFGVWLHGSYKQPPAGAALAATDVLIGLTLAACVLGAVQLVSARRHALAGWIALMLVVWIALSRSSTTWVNAKSLMITSPVVVLLAWGAVPALIAAARGAAARAPALARATRFAVALLALALAGGALASDAAQYHSSNLAPTARYDELASLGDRFAGRGPVLFTDFDEYSMYELRDLDVGGPDFVFPPPALAALARGYGRPVELDRAAPVALRPYPLIVTRRDPSAAPPPTAYGLRWQGRYYEVWGRRRGAPAAILHVAEPGGRPLACGRVERLARLARSEHATLIGAVAPELVRVPLARARRPPGWGHQRKGLAMRRAGRLSVRFELPRAGLWDVWLKGQFMPPVRVRVDALASARIAGELAGNSLVPDTVNPLRLRLSAGAHVLSVSRAGFSLAPGNAGSAVLDSVFLTPANTPARVTRALPSGGAPRALCAGAYRWIELSRAQPRGSIGG